MNRTREGRRSRNGRSCRAELGVATLALLAAVAAHGQSAGTTDPPVVDWNQAGQHVGEEVVVEGRVVGVECSQQVCHLAFEPTTRRFAVVVEALDFDLFPPDVLQDRYNGRRVRVRGRVVRLGARPEIVLRKADQLALVASQPEPAEEAPTELQSVLERQTQVLERLTGLLERIEALTEQLVVTEERMIAVLGQVEQRQGELQAILATMAAPAEEAPTPQGPRVGRWEVMRSIKRGMPASEVERLFGPPSRVDGGSGWATWYYEPNGSVSFDARGRVEAFVGFSSR